MKAFLAPLCLMLGLVAQAQDIQQLDNPVEPDSQTQHIASITALSFAANNHFHQGLQANTRFGYANGLSYEWRKADKIKRVHAFVNYGEVDAKSRVSDSLTANTSGYYFQGAVTYGFGRTLWKSDAQKPVATHFLWGMDLGLFYETAHGSSMEIDVPYVQSGGVLVNPYLAFETTFYGRLVVRAELPVLTQIGISRARFSDPDIPQGTVHHSFGFEQHLFSANNLLSVGWKF